MIYFSKPIAKPVIMYVIHDVIVSHSLRFFNALPVVLTM